MEFLRERKKAGMAFSRWNIEDEAPVKRHDDILQIRRFLRVANHEGWSPQRFCLIHPLF